MKKRIFIAIAMLASSVAFAQKKEKQPQPPPPPPPPVANVKEIPPPPPPPEAAPSKKNSSKDYAAFLKRNPGVKGIDWSQNKVHIRLKTGKEELYDLNNEKEALQFKAKYGELPTPPPPPPPPPPKPIKTKTIS